MVSSLGSLVQSCCGERGALQTNVTGACGEHSQCSGHTGFAPLTGVGSPRLHCSGSRLRYRERALRCMRFQFLGTPQKRGFGWSCVLCLNRPSSSGARSLTGALSPVRRVFSPPRPLPQFPPALVGCTLGLFWGAGLQPQPSQQMSTILNLRKSLVRNWEPVGHLVEVPSLGPSLPLSPPPCLLSPVGMGRSATG